MCGSLLMTAPFTLPHRWRSLQSPQTCSGGISFGVPFVSATHSNKVEDVNGISLAAVLTYPHLCPFIPILNSNLRYSTVGFLLRVLFFMGLSTFLLGLGAAALYGLERVRNSSNNNESLGASVRPFLRSLHSVAGSLATAESGNTREWSSVCRMMHVVCCNRQ